MTEHAALVELLRILRDRNYRFTTVTPATHGIVLKRDAAHEPNLRDIFGWSRPFAKADLDGPLLEALETAGAIETVDGGRLKSRVRVSTIDDTLFVHSAFPTDDPDSVFFGPDTYRFVRFVRQQLPALGNIREVVDMGTGCGAGGILLASERSDARVTLVDVNAEALRFARANAEAAGVEVALVESGRVPDGADLIIANPPYLMDAKSRSYRNGGELLGGAVALDWAEQALSVMTTGGTLLLYTGAAVVDGHSPLLEAIMQRCEATGAALRVEEIDPDVFGDELGAPASREVERIAALGLVIRR